MIKYIPNNIKFRIVSSKVMETYKNSQAFNLTELDRDDVHTFSNTAKEILLLKYDLWYRWLVDVEMTIREHNAFDIGVRKNIVSMCNLTQSRYTTIVYSNPDNFDKDYVNKWVKTHSPLYEYLTEAIITYDAKSISDLFTRIGTVLINIMNATLHELYELDNVINSDNQVFVSVTDVCADFPLVLPNRCLLTERMNVYKTMRDFGDTIDVKRYTDNDIDGVLENMNNFKIRKIHDYV